MRKNNALCEKFASRSLSPEPFGLVAKDEFGLTAIKAFEQKNQWMPASVRRGHNDCNVYSYDTDAGIIAFPTAAMRGWAMRQMPVASLTSLEKVDTKPGGMD